MADEMSDAPRVAGSGKTPPVTLSLKHFEMDGDGEYGNMPHPDTIPGKDALRTARMTKAVELLMVHATPSITVLAAELAVSRATVYRMLSEPAFQLMLRKAMDGRFALIAKEALDTVEKTLREGTPAQRFLAAKWALERFDKVNAMMGMGPEEWRQSRSEADLLEMIANLKPAQATIEETRKQMETIPPVVTPSRTPIQEAASATSDAWKAAEEELVDAELLSSRATSIR